MSIIKPWKLPDSRLRYHEVCFLSSHNSYASKNYGYRYAQQNLTIAKQLDFGVRALMLDTYKVKGTNEIIVCHGKIFTRFIKKEAPMGLSICLEEIKEFMHAHPDEIITIFLENYVTDVTDIDRVLEKAGVAELILKPSDLSNEEGWPTLAWMQQHNKRLVIFNSNGGSSYLFNEWRHVIENQYGTLRVKAAARERTESKAFSKHTRHLYLINYIPTFKVDWGGSFKLINSLFLSQLLAYVDKNGLGKNHDYSARMPNFINVDFVDQGTALDFVNQINERHKENNGIKKT